jgi:modulator of FtsH protease HflK
MMKSTFSLKRWITQSLNDPQWGRGKSDSPPPPPSSGNGDDNKGRRPQKDGDGPPDLDDIVRDMKNKLGGLLGTKPKRPNPFETPRREPSGGGNGGNGGSGGGMQMPKLPIGGIGALLAIAAIIWMGSGFYIVDEGKRGVVLRFGKYIETTQPGPRWHIPYPIETRELVDLSNVKSIEIGKKAGRDSNRSALMLTEDLNIIESVVEVQYTLKDAKEFAFNNLFSRNDPSRVIEQVAETAVREVIGKRKMDSLLSQGGRADVSQATQKLMQDILDRYVTGIRVSKVNLQTITPPEQVVEAFNDVNKAEQDRDRLRNEGQAYANDIIPKARGTAARLLEEASGYQQSVVARAEGDSARFKQLVTEYEKAPGVTRERLYLDMMQAVLGNTSKVLVDQKGSNNLLYLPLDKLMERSRTDAPVSVGAQAEPVRQSIPDPTPDVDVTRNLRSNRDLRSNR